MVRLCNFFCNCDIYVFVIVTSTLGYTSAKYFVLITHILCYTSVSFLVLVMHELCGGKGWAGMGCNNVYVTYVKRWGVKTFI